MPCCVSRLQSVPLQRSSSPWRRSERFWLTPFVRRSAADPLRVTRNILPHHLHQDVHINRFCECRDSAKPLRALLEVERARHHGYRNARDRWIAELCAPEFVAAEARHHQIQQHEAGVSGRPVTDCAQQVQRLETILRGDGVKSLRDQERPTSPGCRDRLPQSTRYRRAFARARSSPVPPLLYGIHAVQRASGAATQNRVRFPRDECRCCRSFLRRVRARGHPCRARGRGPRFPGSSKAGVQTANRFRS